MSETMADFEKEIEASFRKLNEGDVLEGTITNVEDDMAYVDINYHAQGIVKKSDYSDDPSFSMQSINVGDTIKAVVLSDDDGEGNVALSVKEAVKAAAWDTVKKYAEEGGKYTADAYQKAFEEVRATANRWFGKDEAVSMKSFVNDFKNKGLFKVTDEN